MKYVLLILLISFSVLAETVKFQYGDKVKFTDEFYGSCIGRVSDLIAGMYSVEGRCKARSGTVYQGNIGAIDESRLTLIN